MSWLGDTVVGGIGEVVESVGKTVDMFVTTDKEREELEISKARLNLETFAAEVKDRESAREREVRVNESEKAGWLSKNVSSLLAIGCLVLTFLMFYQVLYKTIDPAKQEIVVYILGALSAISTQIISYYFGSSMGSKAKTDMLGKV